MWMTIRWLSMSLTFSRDASVRRTPGLIENDQDGPMHEIGSRIDESRHLLATEHGGQLHGDPGKGQIVKGQIATLERLAVEEPQSRHTILDGAGRKPFLVEQVELEAAYLLRPQSVWRLTEVFR